MGENRASGEGILGGFALKEVRYAEDDCLSINQITARLHSFYDDKFKCVHSKSSWYNKCNSNHSLETGLMVKIINGEKNYA
jgi:hypothetical protein